MKTFSTLIVAFAFCGVFSVSAQVQFTNSNDGELLGEIAVTPGIGEVNEDKQVRIYSYGSVIFIQAQDINTVLKEITVYNAIGQLIYSEDKSTRGFYQINLEGSARGIYLVRINTDEKTYRRKVFVR